MVAQFPVKELIYRDYDDLALIKDVSEPDLERGVRKRDSDCNTVPIPTTHNADEDGCDDRDNSRDKIDNERDRSKSAQCCENTLAEVTCCAL